MPRITESVSILMVPRPPLQGPAVLCSDGSNVLRFVGTLYGTAHDTGRTNERRHFLANATLGVAGSAIGTPALAQSPRDP